MKKLILTMAVVGFAITSVVSNAHAGATDLLFPGELNKASDDSGEYLINDGQGLRTTDVVDTTLDVGDVLRGAFDITSNVDTTGGGGTNFPAGYEWTGIFETEVKSKTFLYVDPDPVSFTFGKAIYNFTFGPSAAFEAELEADARFAAAGDLKGALVAMFDDTPINYDRTGVDGAGDAQEEALVATASDGSPFWVAGFTGAGGTAIAGEGWKASVAPDDISVLKSIPVGSYAGTFNYGLNQIGVPFHPEIVLGQVLTPFGGTAHFNGGGSIEGVMGAITPYDAFDELNVVFKPSIIPEPTTMLLFGTGMMGAFLRRKKRLA